MTLDSHVQSFQVQAPTGRIVAGTPIELTAAASEILDIPGFEVVSGAVDLQVVLKHVQLPAEPGVITPWPPPATATAVVSNITSGLASPPANGSIEGWLASISGTVPVGTHDISDQIRIDLRWRFTDPATGTELSDVVIAGGALDAPAITIIVPPLVTELTTADFAAALQSVAESRRVGVQIVVRGRVGTIQDTGEVTLPPIPLELPIIPIPLPSVAALFRDQDLTGDAVLVMVPEGSALSSVSIVSGVLSSLSSLLDAVNTAAVGTTWITGTKGLYSAVTSLANRIPLTKHVGFQARDSHNNLGKYNFITRKWWWDTDIEDRGSSTLLISATRAISFFQHDDFGGKELKLDANPGVSGRFGGAAVRHLHVSSPESTPPGSVSITGTPGGGTWGDVISSYRWGRPFSPLVG